MTALPLTQAIENIYTSLLANNDNLDAHIDALKAALTAAGQKEAVFDPARLAQGNRHGRRLMESYFTKRGVKVAFKAEK